MRLFGMRLALLVALLLASATEIPGPMIASPPPGATVKVASAAVAPPSSREILRQSAAALASSRIQSELGLSAAAGIGPKATRAHATGYAIPADLPRAPVGRFKLTAYSGPQLGQARPVTATGTIARAGRTVAVDPKVIPLGSRVYIDGIGERIAEDVGGGIKGNHIDVYVHTLPQAKVFGVKRGHTVSVIALPEKRRASRRGASTGS